MKKKLSILSALLLCIATLTGCGNTLSVSSTDVTEPHSAVLKETEDMGREYIDGFIFFGESTTYHLKSRGVLRGGTETKQVLHDRSGTAILDSSTWRMAVISQKHGEYVSLGEAISELKPKRILLTFGLNGAVANKKRGEEFYKECYRKLINTVREASPQTRIILGSCFPVAENMDMSRYTVTASELNEIIATLNGWTLELAEDDGLYYLNVNEILTDEKGYLKNEYQVGDGHHLTAEAYTHILGYIRTHGIKEDA